MSNIVRVKFLYRAAVNELGSRHAYSAGMLDRRTELLKDIADLRPRLESLDEAIPDAIRSRERALVAVGQGARQRCSKTLL